MVKVRLLVSVADGNRGSVIEVDERRADNLIGVGFATYVEDSWDAEDLTGGEEE